MTSRITTADDHSLSRESMLNILQRLLPEARIERAGDLAGVLRLAGGGRQPDSLILDLRLLGLTHIEMLTDSRRRFSRTILIVIPMVNDPQLIGGVVNTGANDLLGKSIAPEEPGRAILAIRTEEVLARYGPSGLLPLQSSPRLEELTEHRPGVLHPLAQGKSNKEIGRALDIPRYTVRIHVSSLLRALGVPSRITAAMKYRVALGHGDGE